MDGRLMLLPVLLIALFTLSVSGQLIASIDCGASDSTVDLNGISWTPDDTLVSNGISHVVQSSNSVSTVMDTLRVFTGRKKNCYSLGPITQGQKVLLRASFNYGNYDRLSNPPTFDLHFDGNFWTEVETTASGVLKYETTYVAKGDAVSVCVAQTKPGQFPFISALELRGLEQDIYSELDDNRALFLAVRYSYGASVPVRYPNDGYDRIWIPRPASGGLEQVTNDAIFIDPTGPNNPPTEVFENAITVESTDYYVILGQFRTPLPPLYINMYFSEVSSLDFSEKRSFNIEKRSTLGNTPVPPPVLPPYRKVDVRSLYNFKVDYNTNLSLVATSDSDLPPIINAYEVFKISDVLTDGTNSDDVKALASLISTFKVLGGWHGDPCLPATYSWDWLNCSNDATPRVTSLYLNSFGLSGLLPDISSMDALQIIDLHNNSLVGTIPSFLGTMPKLRQLNLADNLFTGSVPTSISRNNQLRLNVTGNPSLCTSGKSCSSSTGKKKSMLPLILGIAIPAFILIWVVVGVFIILRRKKISDNVNMRGVPTGVGANEAAVGVLNVNPNMVQTAAGEVMIKEMVENVAHKDGVPPLSNTPAQSSNYSGQTRN